MDPLKLIKWFGGGLGLLLVAWWVWVLYAGNIRMGRTFIEEADFSREKDPVSYYTGVIVLALFIAAYWAGVIWLLRHLPKYLDQVQQK